MTQRGRSEIGVFVLVSPICEVLNIIEFPLGALGHDVKVDDKNKLDNEYPNHPRRHILSSVPLCVAALRPKAPVRLIL